MATGELRPVPDPTTLTTAQLHREILALKELLETRLEGLEKAILLQNVVYNKYPDTLEATRDNLMELLDCRFNNIAQQLKDREIRWNELILNMTHSSEIALHTNREANTKSEIAFTKNIDALQRVVQVQGEGLNDKITDVKDRLNNREGQAVGSKDNTGFLVAVGGLLAAVATVVILLFRAQMH